MPEPIHIRVIGEFSDLPAKLHAIAREYTEHRPMSDDCRNMTDEEFDEAYRSHEEYGEVFDEIVLTMCKYLQWAKKF